MINNNTPKRKLTEEDILNLGNQQEEVTQPEVSNAPRVKLDEAEFKKQLPISTSAEHIDSIVQENYERMIADLKANKDLGDRVLTGANNFYLGLSSFVPAALKTQAILKTALYNAFRDEDEKLNALYAPEWLAGQAVGKQLEEIFVTNPLLRDEFLAGTLAKGAGQLTGNIILGLASGGSATVGGVLSGAANATLSADTYKEAIDSGASIEAAFESTIANMAGTAILESVPTALFLKRLDKATGGGFKKILANGFKGSVVEGSTEAIQEMYSNAVAGTMYDKTRDLMDGVGEAFLAGAILGGGVDVVTNVLVQKHAEAKTPEEKVDAEDSIAYVVEMYGDQMDTEQGELANFLEVTVNDPESSIAKEEVITTQRGIGVTREKMTIRAKRAFSNWWENNATSTGVLGKGIKLLQEQKDSAIATEVERSRLYLTQLNESILKFYGSTNKSLTKALNDKSDPVPKSIMLDIDNALRNKDAIESLPTQLQEPVSNMRRQIDTLTSEYARRGIAQGDLLVTMSNNIGSYIHRSYKLFDQDVDWQESTIPPDVWNNAVRFISSQIHNDLNIKGVSKKKAEVNAQAEQQIRDILHNKSVASIYRMFSDPDKAVAVDQADRDVLLERTDLPAPIRDLMGEYKEASVNYLKTIEKMATTLESRTFFDTIADLFDNKLFFKSTSDLPVGDYENYVSGLPTGVGSKLERRLMHKDLFEALTLDKREDQNVFITGLYRANAMAKYSKTVLSHVSHARNVLGGIGFMTFNGHFNKHKTEYYKKAFSAVRSYKSLNKKELQDTYLEYVSLGLTGGSVSAGEFRDVLQDANMEAANFMEANFNHISATAKGKGLYKKSKSMFRKFSRKAAKLYQAEDAFLRITMFELELARLREADPSISKQEVADLVNDIYPNYDRVPEIAKKFRKVPFVAPFLSFPSEVIRTSMNSTKRGIAEMKSDNPKIQKIGRKRIAGNIITLAGTSAMGAVSQLFLSLSDEEEENFRQFLPPWAEGSVVMYTSASRGKVRYINTSYTNPYGFMIDPVNSIIAGDSDRDVLEKFGDSMYQLLSPILSEELASKALREFFANDVDGREIYNPEDGLGDKMSKSFAHFWNVVEPGSISSAQRLAEPFIDEDSKKAPGDEMLGFLGLRISTIDIAESYGFKLRDYRSQIRDVRRVYNSAKYNKRSSSEEVRNKFRETNARYKEIFTEIEQITEAARRSGVSFRELENIMKDSGLSNKDIEAVRRGVFIPFER